MEGYQLDPADVKPGGMLNLTLYWRTTQRIDEKYTVFNQVLGADKRIVGQQDGQPGCEAMPTDDWPVGELIADHYQVPIQADAAPGNYTLITGMYDTRTLVRLAVYTGTNQPVGNEIDLAQIKMNEG